MTSAKVRAVVQLHDQRMTDAHAHIEQRLEEVAADCEGQPDGSVVIDGRLLLGFTFLDANRGIAELCKALRQSPLRRGSAIQVLLSKRDEMPNWIEFPID